MLQDEEEDGDEVPSSFIGAADGVMSVATRPDAAASDQVELANGTEGHS